MNLAAALALVLAAQAQDAPPVELVCRVQLTLQPLTATSVMNERERRFPAREVAEMLRDREREDFSLGADGNAQHVLRLSIRPDNGSELFSDRRFGVNDANERDFVRVDSQPDRYLVYFSDDEDDEPLTISRTNGRIEGGTISLDLDYGAVIGANVKARVRASGRCQRYTEADRIF